MALKLKTAPASEPVSLDEAKDHLRVTGSDDDSLIASLITMARERAESICGRALITQTWELYLNEFPAGCIEVPLPPLQSVVEITYTDTDGNIQTLASDKYTVHPEYTPGKICPAWATAWPGTRSIQSAVKVEFKAGYGDAPDVPGPIKQWILIYVGTLYENRESVVIGRYVAPLKFVDGLLDEYRVRRVW